MIHLKDIEFSYSDKTVLNIDELQFPATGLISIIGKNGAGKSTLLKLMAGIHRTKGSIMYGKRHLNSLSPVILASLRSYVPQNTEVHFPFTVRQFIAFGMYRNMNLLSGISIREESMIDEITAFLEIDSIAEKSINEISGGELQKSHIARALFQDTPVMLLDEPVSNIDIHYKFTIMKKLRTLSENHLIVYVTHDVNNALNNSDRILSIKNGKPVFFQQSSYCAQHLDLVYDKGFIVEKIGESYFIIDEELK